MASGRSARALVRYAMARTVRDSGRRGAVIQHPVKSSGSAPATVPAATAVPASRPAVNHACVRALLHLLPPTPRLRDLGHRVVERAVDVDAEGEQVACERDVSRPKLAARLVADLTHSALRKGGSVVEKLGGKVGEHQVLGLDAAGEPACYLRRRMAMRAGRAIDVGGAHLQQAGWDGDGWWTGRWRAGTTAACRLAGVACMPQGGRGAGKTGGDVTPLMRSSEVHAFVLS